MDDLKVSHMSSNVVEDFLNWVKQTYGAIGEVKITQGKLHGYLRMTLGYRVRGQVTIDMVKYIKHIIKSFPQGYINDKKDALPWSENLFKISDHSRLLNKER